MAFAGGPFNSFVLHATAAMARRLREQPGLGLVTTVSGMLTKPGLAVWSSAPDGGPPLVDDLAASATAATDTIAVASGHEGPATIAACTVTYDGMEPKELVAILDTNDGSSSSSSRVIAKSSDADLMTRAMSEELVGTTFEVSGNTLA
jgi:acetyl-CoA C-acetyltransferase